MNSTPVIDRVCDRKKFADFAKIRRFFYYSIILWKHNPFRRICGDFLRRGEKSKRAAKFFVDEKILRGKKMEIARRGRNHS